MPLRPPRRYFRYEKKAQRPLSRRHFAGRLFAHFLIVVALVAVSLLIGMAGYHRYEHLGWLDAFLNAAMLLGGMGPVTTPVTRAGKLFAGGYALYAGLVFLVGAGILLAPFFHRIIHRFHWEQEHGDA